MAFVGKFVLVMLLLLLLLAPIAPPLEFAARVLFAFNGADIGAFEDACENDDELVELLAPRLFDLLRREPPLDEVLWASGFDGTAAEAAATTGALVFWA